MNMVFFFISTKGFKFKILLEKYAKSMHVTLDQRDLLIN